MAANLASHESWEVIPTDDLQDAIRVAEDTVAKRISQDAVTSRWQSKASPSTVKKSFNFVLSAQEKREQAKEKASSAGRPAMPPAINGKLLTKFLRNGTPLCSLYQTG